MSGYVNDMWPGSPQKDSPSTARSGRSSRPSSASGASRSGSSGCGSPSSSGSRPAPRRGSPPRSGRRHPGQHRRSSRSCSRSRSRSRSRRARPGPRRAARRPQRPPPRRRSRSRSRSRGRSPSRRARGVPRGRRYYGFGRTVYPEQHRGWRARSRTRSRSRTPFRLSEKDRMELLEIAKANAAKALGTTNFDLPASLRTVSVSKTNFGTSVPNGAKFEMSENLTEDGTKNPNEKSSQQKSIAFSSHNSVAKPMLQKPAKTTAIETSSGSPKIDLKKSPYGLWIPI
ncbi:arginine/serine-rich protein 1 [Talpa occidentalis]|uniref:arginine/serine-rich protein 1 n=1 Tax=Talpa occidentalis TaxID=50954 RepID=UPI00188EAF77|nr:arginine/serine-rich protein 1 [Talpa occidentalis]